MSEKDEGTPKHGRRHGSVIPDDRSHGIQSTISLFVSQDKHLDRGSSSPTASTAELIMTSEDLLNAHDSGPNPVTSTSVAAAAAAAAAAATPLDEDMKMPMIPMKKFQQKDSIVVNTRDQDELPLWYVVLSPREVKGAAGPFTVAELRDKFSTAEIHDRTLTWKNGNAKWHELKHLAYLYPKVLLSRPLLASI